MHTATFNRIDDFLGWLLGLVEKLENFFSHRPRVGDLYLTDWDYENRCYEGAYVVEEVRDDWVKTRFCGIGDNYRSNVAQIIKISTLNMCYTRVRPEQIGAKNK